MKTKIKKGDKVKIINGDYCFENYSEFFEKLGFNEAVHIEHWGNPSNATCMIGFIKEAG